MTAPIAPAAAGTPDTSMGITDDLMASIAADSARQTMEASEPAPEQPRGTDGKFRPKAADAKPDGTAAPVESVATEAVVPEGTEVEGEGNSDDAVLPEGFVAVPTITRQPITPFKVFDADGELEAPELTIEFQANGKTRREPLDKLTKLAQWGVYNEERERAVTQSAQRLREIESDYQRLQDRVKASDAKLLAVLQDDNALLNERERLAAENTPDALRRKLEEERAQDRMQRELSDLHAVGTQFYTGEVLPALDMIKKALPYVASEEIDAKAIIDTERFKTIRLPDGSTAIHPRDYDKFRQYVVDELTPWAQHIHDARASERGAVSQKTQKTVEDAQVRAQKKTNQMSKALKPVGRAEKVTAPPKRIENIDDAMADALKSTLSAMGTS